jgi:peptide/nickel transport system permease protein
MTNLVVPRAVPRLQPGFRIGHVRPLHAIALLTLGLLLAAALRPGLFTPYSAIDSDLLNALTGPSRQHPFGTDQLGRDVLARVAHGATISLSIGAFSVLLALAGGIVLGLVSGIGDNWASRVTARILDVLAAFPVLLLTLVVISILGRGTLQLVLAIGIASVAEYSRLIRSQVLAIRARGYVEASVEIGNSDVVTILRHVLPNAMGPVLVIATVGVGTAILVGSSLSFLGFGPPSPAPEWGVMLADGRDYALIAWWLVLFPGIALTATVFSVTILGRALQDRFEGRTQ